MKTIRKIYKSLKLFILKFFLSRNAIAYIRLTDRVKELNDGWKPDWSNENERKYYPWFYYDRSSSAFRYFVTGFTSSATLTSVGSRLCLRTRELAEQIGQEEEKTYNDYLS